MVQMEVALVAENTIHDQPTRSGHNHHVLTHIGVAPVKSDGHRLCCEFAHCWTKRIMYHEAR